MTNVNKKMVFFNEGFPYRVLGISIGIDVKIGETRDQEFRLLATYRGSEGRGRGRPRRGRGRQWRLRLLGSRRRLKVPEVGLLQGRGRREVRGVRLEKESYDPALSRYYLRTCATVSAPGPGGSW